MFNFIANEIVFLEKNDKDHIGHYSASEILTTHGIRFLIPAGIRNDRDYVISTKGRNLMPAMNIKPLALFEMK